MLAYSYLFISHNFLEPGATAKESWDRLNHRELCHDSIFPCFILYSAFPERMAVQYAANLTLFCLIGFLALVYQFVQFNYASQKDAINNDDDYLFSR